MEKSETGAIGRALANLGYGTQFAPDLDEQDRIVDSPVRMVESKKDPVLHKSVYQMVDGYIFPESVKKYAGKNIYSIPNQELENYYNYMTEWYQKEGREPKGVWIEVLSKIKEHLEK